MKTGLTIYWCLLVYISYQGYKVGYQEYIRLCTISGLMLIKQYGHFDTLRLGVDGYGEVNQHV